MASFFSDTIKTRSFKMCMVITMLGIYIVTLGLMTVTLFKFTAVSEKILIANCVFWILVLCSLNVARLLRTLMIMKNMICVTLVCLQGK